MSSGAVVMMVIGIVIIWGGLIASVANAVVKARQEKN